MSNGTTIRASSDVALEPGPAFAMIAEDHLLVVGCGGGALLKEALRSGCRFATTPSPAPR